MIGVFGNFIFNVQFSFICWVLTYSDNLFTESVFSEVSRVDSQTRHKLTRLQACNLTVRLLNLMGFSDVSK